MAAIQSSKSSALISIGVQKYLKCEEGDLKFYRELCCPNFQTENAKTQGYVHIKCLTNNKFWRRAPDQVTSPLKIEAIADEPNENINDEGCTLFRIENVRPYIETEVGPNIEIEVGPNTKIGEICRIFHVQSSLYTRPYPDPDLNPRPHSNLAEILCAVKPHPDPSRMDLFIKVY